MRGIKRAIFRPNWKLSCKWTSFSSTFDSVICHAAFWFALRFKQWASELLPNDTGQHLKWWFDIRGANDEERILFSFTELQCIEQSGINFCRLQCSFSTPTKKESFFNSSKFTLFCYCWCGSCWCIKLHSYISVYMWHCWLDKNIFVFLFCGRFEKISSKNMDAFYDRLTISPVISMHYFAIQIQHQPQMTCHILEATYRIMGVQTK